MNENNLQDYAVLKRIADNRKSVRKYSDKPVSEEDLLRIIDIAKTSPVASGRKNWDIEIISDKAILHEISARINEYFLEFADNIKSDFRDDFIEYSKNFTFFESASSVMFLMYRVVPTTSRSVDKSIANDELLSKIEIWEKENSAKSISCAAMLVLLAAESLGLGACYMTGALLAEERFIELVSNKQGRRIGAIIPVGHY